MKVLVLPPALELVLLLVLLVGVSKRSYKILLYNSMHDRYGIHTSLELFNFLSSISLNINSIDLGTIPGSDLVPLIVCVFQMQI